MGLAGWFARRTGADASPRADALLAADATPENRGDAIHVSSMRWRGSEEELTLSPYAKAPRGGLEELDGDDWMQLGVSRLILLANMQSDEVQNEVHSFAEEFPARAQEKNGLAPREVAIRLSEIGTQLSQYGYLTESLEISLAALDVSALQPDSELTMSVGSETAHLPASCNDEKHVRKALNVYETMDSSAIAEANPNSGPWNRLFGAYTRGQCLGIPPAYGTDASICAHVADRGLRVLPASRGDQRRDSRPTHSTGGASARSCRHGLLARPRNERSWAKQ